MAGSGVGRWCTAKGAAGGGGNGRLLGGEKNGSLVSNRETSSLEGALAT